MARTTSAARGKNHKRLKKGTRSTKLHRFEPFSERIAKLKIDPVRRARGSNFDEGNGEDKSTYFRSSLDHWVELNQSESFSRFFQLVSPLCESLPQIIYHEDKIMGLLLEYIEKRDALSMEPLLSLMAQFSRDLGSRFEKHFGPAVALVVRVAATHESVEVIEWSFSCLAWIFKFLSRLLAPDLRPVLGIMIPYLGKEHQKHFVSRFAAESMSFLIRKAALVSNKNRKPLEMAVAFLFEDLARVEGTRQASSYQEGLMSMFSEGIKGVKGGLHSTGVDIFRCLVDAAIARPTGNTLAEGVLYGVLVNVIHYSNADTFAPILVVVCGSLEPSSSDTSRKRSVRIRARLVFLSLAARKSSRVKDWERPLRFLANLLENQTESPDLCSQAAQGIIGAAALAIQNSPMDALLPCMRPIIEPLTKGNLAKYFLPFCGVFSSFGCDRFYTIVLPYLQRFIIDHWRNYEHALALTLPKLQTANCVTSEPNKPGYLFCPPAWKATIQDSFRQQDLSTERVAMLYSYTRIRPAICLSSQPSILPEVLERLHGVVVNGFQSSSGFGEDLKTFARGQAFLSYAELGAQLEALDLELWDVVISQGSECANRPVFLEATLIYVASCQPSRLDDSDERLEALITSLIANLSKPSNRVRLLSLLLLQHIIPMVNGGEVSLIQIAVDIEKSELSLHTARTLSMEVRRLASKYAEASSNKWLSRLLPNFLFGLLWKKMSSLWQDSCEAIKVVAGTPVGEKVVAELALSWLQDTPPSAQPFSGMTDPDDSTEYSNMSSPFECFNVASVEKAIIFSFLEVDNAKVAVNEDFKATHSAVQGIPLTARAKALQVFNAVPQLAEKRSRQITPIFLSWATSDEDPSNALESESGSSATLTDDHRVWTLRDKKSMLAMFGQFTNPKVLYKSPNVFDALVVLLGNGDPELQKSALKAIYTWKLPSIHPYEENLLNIVDDARFKDELAVFVHVNQENSIIKQADCEELLPIVLRLLYGRVISRAGSQSSQGGQEGRRKAILRSVCQLPEEYFTAFIRIAFGSLNDIRILDGSGQISTCISKELMTLRRQVGLLRMVDTMLETLKGRMLAHADRCMNVVLYCIIRSCRQLRSLQTENNGKPIDNNNPELLRNIRQIGIHCLHLIFSISPGVDWDQYLPIIFSEIIDERLEKFAIETAQGVSGLLRLFHTWACNRKTVSYLVEPRPVIRQVVDCLEVYSARDEVKIFVLDEVLGTIFRLASDKTSDKDNGSPHTLSYPSWFQHFVPHLEYILLRIGHLLSLSPNRHLTTSGVGILSMIAPFVETSEGAERLINTATLLLREPADRVPPKTKGDLLLVLRHFLPLWKRDDDLPLVEQLFEVLSSLFDYFKDNDNRQRLADVFSIFANDDEELRDVATLCKDLNAISELRLDEMDFRRRLDAFNIINEQKSGIFSARQWRPLLFNMLYHVKNESELVIRSSASYALKRFIECSKSVGETDHPRFGALIDSILLPAFRSGVKNNSEMVRSEYVSVMGCLIELQPLHLAISDMQPLLAGGDQEASFFNNILHIQQYRRVRALRRLAGEVSKGNLRGGNISSFFLPLIEHFVFNQAEDENAHNLAAEAVSAIGVLSEWLEWNHFRAIFRRYKGYLHTKVGMEKNVIRLLGQLVDGLSRAISMESPDNALQKDEPELKSALRNSLPGKLQMAKEFKENHIPGFANFIHLKNGSEVNLRVPIAFIAVKLIKLLPEDDVALLLPPVLLDLSNVLRSRSQESRDIARKTLNDIALVLGPSYFRYILNELRTALNKGYQLHVLSYTVHSMLVVTNDSFKPGDLDQNLAQLASVVMGDIFGAVGQEKDAEGYVSSMKEVKSSKSYDSMELLAKIATIPHLSDLLLPIQSLLHGNLTSSLVKKIDELLRRIGLGVLRNPGSASRDVLVFCYELIKESYKTEDVTQRNGDELNEAVRRYIVAKPRNRAVGGSTTSHLYKLCRFSLDVLRAVLNKHNTLLTAKNVAGFLPMIGDALVQGHEEVKFSALRLLSTIIKLPLVEIDINSEAYVVEAVKMIKEAPSTNTEASQAALKLIASLLRERPATKIRDSHLGYLLKRIAADIEEPDRQGVTFNFIRAVLGRKIMIPEVYELVDNIAAMMVRNHTRSARDLAKGVFVHFLIEYPQAKSRWSNQLGFLAKNLNYQYKEGRQSAMEAVHLLLSKTNGAPAQDIVCTFFVSLVMVMSNDESAECREMAGVLLSDIFGRADAERLKSILAAVRAWLEQTQNPSLVRTGLQAMRLFFGGGDSRLNDEAEAKYVIGLLPSILASPLEPQEEPTWEVVYYSLQLFAKICKLCPAVALAQECAALWAIIRDCLTYPHPWVKFCAANLIGIWLADEAKSNAAVGYGNVPLLGAWGLQLDSDTMLDLARKSMQCLKSRNTSEELASQALRNLIFLGRCFAQNKLYFDTEQVEDSADDVTEGSDAEIQDDTTAMFRNKIGGKPAICFIFEQAAAILRREPLTTKAESLTSKTACMKLIASLCNNLEADEVKPSLQTVLLPLLHLTDSSIPAPRSSDESFQSAYKSLVLSSQEILDLLQRKLGTTGFVADVAEAMERVKARRDERRVKRKIEAVSDPVKFGQEKKRKNERKREKRKERAQDYRGQRRGW